MYYIICIPCTYMGLLLLLLLAYEALYNSNIENHDSITSNNNSDDNSNDNSNNDSKHNSNNDSNNDSNDNSTFYEALDVCLIYIHILLCTLSYYIYIYIYIYTLQGLGPL